LILDTKNGVKKIPKKNTKFKFTIPETKEELIVNGNDIINLPENRPKRIVRRL